MHDTFSTSEAPDCSRTRPVDVVKITWSRAATDVRIARMPVIR